MKPSDITTYLGTDRIARLGATEAQIADMAGRAPDVPTAAIWLMQRCGVKPNEDDVKRWSDDVRALKANPVSPVKPVKKVKV